MIFKNTVANMLGQIIESALPILLLPLFIHYLGIEAFGLVGYFASLIGLLTIFHDGIGLALQREIARRESVDLEHEKQGDLIYTFEIIYWLFGIVVAIVLILLSGIIEKYGIHQEHISQETVYYSFLLISFRTLFTFPTSLYLAVLRGKQKQILCNTISCISSISGAIISLLSVIIFKSIIAFCIAQILNVLINIIALRLYVQKSMKDSERKSKKFSYIELEKLWRISLELIVFHGAGVIIKQIDRIFIGMLLPLESLGYYNIGATGGQLMTKLMKPFMMAVYPKTCNLINARNNKIFINHIIQNFKVTSIVSISFGLIIMFYSSEILNLWLNNQKIVESVNNIFILFLIGGMFNVWNNVFYMSQTAMFKVRPALWYICISLIWYPIFLFYFIKEYGLVGATIPYILYRLFGWLYSLNITSKLIIEFKYYKKQYFFDLIKSMIFGFLFVYSFYVAGKVIFDNTYYAQLLFASVNLLSVFTLLYYINFGKVLPKYLLFWQR